MAAALYCVVLAVFCASSCGLAEKGNFQLCSSSSGGEPGEAGSYSPSISADGRYVAFASDASNLLSGIEGQERQVFRKDLATGEIALCSSTLSGEPGNGASDSPSISADGRYVVFQSDSDNLIPEDKNGFVDVFRKDLATGEVICCSANKEGEIGDMVSGQPAISYDGRYVAFCTGAKNLTGLDFLSGLVVRKDIATGDLLPCSVSENGEPQDGDVYHPRISSDGRYVVFSSDAGNLIPEYSSQLVPKETKYGPRRIHNIYRKDLLTGEVVICSTNAKGELGNNESNAASISADGRYVVFSSYASNLVRGDGNHKEDVFRKDLLTGEVFICSARRRGGNGNSSEGSISSDGRYVVFESDSNNLGPVDGNGYTDIYRWEAPSKR
jgi:Tol biopolymer transport system component